MPYLIDIKWFGCIHCRKPHYQCINFIEFYVLNNNNEVIDSICLYPNETKDGRFYEVDKERYDKIKKYMNDKGELELIWNTERSP